MQSFEVKSTAHKPAIVAFTDLLKAFDNMKRMPLTSDPLKYWKAKEDECREMYNVHGENSLCGPWFTISH